jgi:hypothetical protein
MNDNPVDPQLKQLIQSSVGHVDPALRRDLWPELSQRLDERGRRSKTIRLKWWEWALAAGDLGAAFYAPDAIPALLYHL